MHLIHLIWGFLLLFLVVDEILPFVVQLFIFKDFVTSSSVQFVWLHVDNWLQLLLPEFFLPWLGGRGGTQWALMCHLKMGCHLFDATLRTWVPHKHPDNSTNQFLAIFGPV